MNVDNWKNGMWMQRHWWIFIVALITYIGGYLIPFVNWGEVSWLKVLSYVLAKLGETVLIGGLIAFFSSYKTIINGYRTELKGLLLETDFLERRNDIDDIWERVSEVICKTKFPNISKQLLGLVKSSYLESKDNIRCYHNYDTTIVMKWGSADKKWVEIWDKAEFLLFADTTKEILLPQTNITNATDDNDGTCVEITLADGGQTIMSKGVYDPKKKGIFCKASIPLRDQLQYNIIKTMKRRFNLEVDNFLGFRAKYITNGMSIKVSHPDDMELTIVERGTIKDFKENKINDITCEYKYDGLILPRQGYTIFISHI